MPFLLRRLRDGLYFRNELHPGRGVRSYFSYDPRDCRAFLTREGALRASVPLDLPTLNARMNHKLMERMPVTTASNYRARVCRELFDETYEILEYASNVSV